jgi:hypothetical protein
MITKSRCRNPYTIHVPTPTVKVRNIVSDRSPADPVSQHFFSCGKYETVVQNAAKNHSTVHDEEIHCGGCSFLSRVNVLVRKVVRLTAQPEPFASQTFENLFRVHTYYLSFSKQMHGPFRNSSDQRAAYKRGRPLQKLSVDHEHDARKPIKCQKLHHQFRATASSSPRRAAAYFWSSMGRLSRASILTSAYCIGAPRS